MMSIGIILPVVFYSQETQVLDETGIKYSLSQCELRDTTFYQIDALSPYYDAEEITSGTDPRGKEYTAIHSSGTRFITPILINELTAILEAHLNQTAFLFLKS